MIKVDGTQVLHVKVKEGSTETELNYVKNGTNAFFYARPFTLTLRPSHSSFKIKRTSSNEPSASIGDLSNGSQIYYGDVLEIYNLVSDFGYENAKTIINGSYKSSVTVTADTYVDSTATAIILCTIKRGTWTSTVGGKTTYIGYKLIGPDTVTTSSSSALTVYLKDMPSNATGLQIIGYYNGTSYWLTNQHFRYYNGTMYDSYERDKVYTINVTRQATVNCGGSGSSSLNYDWWYGKDTNISCSINLLPSGYFYCPPTGQRTMSDTWSGTIRFNGGTERSGTLPFYCDIWPNDDTKVSKGSSNVDAGDSSATAVAVVYMGADHAKDNYASATVYLNMNITAKSSSYNFSKFTYSVA